MSKVPRKWIQLIKSVNELEKILDTDSIDVEFGIKSDFTVVIFQVRPLTAVKQCNIDKLDAKIARIIIKNKKKFVKLKTQKRNLHDKAIFSDMSDWNPAEIIGNNPNDLDYSLYDYLIMDGAWYKGRKILGYQDVHFPKLMVKFGNKPYVDVRKSFRSLIPNLLKEKTKKKLLKFYFKKLEENPHLHDKVEFEVLFTCYDFNMDKRMIELKEHGFTDKEISEIKNVLLDFTNTIIGVFPDFVEKCKTSLEIMNTNREKIRNESMRRKNNHRKLFYFAEMLLSDCRKFGAIQFSAMARIGFIGSILLKTLKNRSIVTDDFVAAFMCSIETPLTEIQSDLELFVKKQITKKEFLKKYGHLRPGTYDINAIRYDKNEKFFENIKYLQRTSKNQVLDNTKQINDFLLNEKLDFTKTSFFEFVKEALTQREKLKFEFTRNLSDAMEIMVEGGKILGFSRNDLANLTINDILKAKHMSRDKIIKKWKKIIHKNEKRKTLNNYLLLPPIIFSENDFEIITHYFAEPNYITNKSISGNLTYLQHSNNIPDLKETIVLIENADPGYDWIFTKAPIGLITKYGGVASHMAIRCAELGLPAAIGCGEILFEKLLFAKRAMLDCKNEQIIILQHEKSDEYVEERKILKSLGYIK